MDQEKIGKLIKKIRIEGKYSQKGFADKYGVTPQAVSKWKKYSRYSYFKRNL